MKYWNKQKKSREHWTTVRITGYPANMGWPGLKRWCQNYESKGRFFSGPYHSKDWYFEFADDALVFKLKHGYK